MRQYTIPHNYKDNGRVFNLFPARLFTRALIIFVPISFVIFYLPFSLKVKLVLEIFFALPPTLAILFGFSDWLIWLLLFLRRKKIYSLGGSHVETAYPKIYSRAANAGAASRH